MGTPLKSSGVFTNQTNTATMLAKTPGPEWTVSLLVLSLTIHGCTVLFLVIRAALTRWTQIQSGKKKSSIATLHLKSDWLLPKILTEQLVTWTLIVLSVVVIASGDLLKYPLIARLSRDLVLCRVVFCINIGRHIYKVTVAIMYCQHQSQFKVDFLHHTVTLCCYGVFHYYSENLFLGLVGILMEGDTIWSDIIRILKKVGCDSDCTAYRRLVIISASATVSSRGILPIVSMAIALSKQNLMDMHFVIILFWFIALIFFGALNFWMIGVAAMRMRGLCLGHPLPVRFANDLEEAPPIGNCCQGESSSSTSTQRNHIPLTERAIPLQYKNDLSYLSPFSNVNITYDTTDNKYNLYNKKITTKETVNNITVLLKQTQLTANTGNRSQRTRATRQIHQVQQVNDSETNVDSGSNTEPQTSPGTDINDRTTDNSAHIVNFETRLDETSSSLRHVVVSTRNPVQHRTEQGSSRAQLK